MPLRIELSGMTVRENLYGSSPYAGITRIRFEGFEVFLLGLLPGGYLRPVMVTANALK